MVGGWGECAGKWVSTIQLNRTLKKRGTKRESGGIIAYIRDELVSDKTQFLKDSDDVVWLKLDGSLFNLYVDVFLCLIYNVSEGSSRQRLLDNINLFDRLSDHMVHIKNWPITGAIS